MFISFDDQLTYIWLPHPHTFRIPRAHSSRFTGHAVDHIVLSWVYRYSFLRPYNYLSHLGNVHQFSVFINITEHSLRFLLRLGSGYGDIVLFYNIRRVVCRDKVIQLELCLHFSRIITIFLAFHCNHVCKFISDREKIYITCRPYSNTAAGFNACLSLCTSGVHKLNSMTNWWYKLDYESSPVT